MKGIVEMRARGHYSIDDILAEQDKIAVRCRLRAMKKGKFKSIPATEKQILVKQIEIHKIVGGKVVEVLGFSDSQNMMNQLETKGK